MKIRSVGLRDRAEWLRMRWALYGDEEAVHTREIEEFYAGTRREPQAVLVAEDEEGALVGLAELSIRPYVEGCRTEGVGYLEGWWVNPPARGRGIGRMLLVASEDWARAQGCQEFASDTEIDNDESARAHRACGFDEVGLMRCFRKVLGH